MTMAFLLMAIFATVATLIVAATIGLLLRHIIRPVLQGAIRGIQFIGRFTLELLRDLLAACWHLVFAVLSLPMVIGAMLLGRFDVARGVTGRIGARFRRVGRRVSGLMTKSAAAGTVPRRTPRSTPGGSEVQGEFPGWKVVGQLQSGGSGAVMHIAEPSTGAPPNAPDRVVIKCFDLSGGTPLGQMIRESRALEGAKKLGLVIEHNHDESRFWYVMPFIPGTHLAESVEGLHTDGLSLNLDALKLTLGWHRDLLVSLRAYHGAGLWHKDVKPENIITNDTGAHLVDFGLVTPLQSAMTLTTHGTEYFRDPELVRQALRGAKVSEVDGSRFDLYSAGAVLYFMVEGTFPAHGNLSRFGREGGDAIKWVIRRAMADYHQRYASVDAMLADVALLAGAADPRRVRPADLPSFNGSEPTQEVPTMVPPVPSTTATHRRPRIEVTDWWSGAYRVRDAVPGAPPDTPNAFSAAEQAKERARQERADRRAARKARRRASVGGAFAFLIGLLVLGGGYIAMVNGVPSPEPSAVVAAESYAEIPSGAGHALIVNDHPRRLDAATRVAGQLQAGGWDFTADTSLEADFRRGLPINGVESSDFPELARLVLRKHGLSAAAVVMAPDDDPNGVEVIFVTQDHMKTYRLPELATDATDVQLAP